jgi:hypothetical protein
MKIAISMLAGLQYSSFHERTDSDSGQFTSSKTKITTLSLSLAVESLAPISRGSLAAWRSGVDKFLPQAHVMMNQVHCNKWET